ncbi:endolytic transglycosylase MltG [Acetobacter vaccinii]|uniref:endolytic transglycosylase MltG n=1 Tax=Acetobacter vaccinii TaxID=2592655 RepID=UPI0038D1A5EE
MASERKQKTTSPPASRRWLSIVFKGVLGGVAALGVSATCLGLLAWHDYTRLGPLPQDTDIVVPHGGYTSTLASLQSAKALPDDWWTEYLFQVAVTLTRKDGQLHAAELRFPAQASMQQILWVLRHGKPVMHKLTIPEGLSAHQIQALVDHAPFLTGPTPLPTEGQVLPQTYSYQRNTQRAALLDRMQADMASTLDTIWKNRDSTEGLTDPQSLLVLASLIEKETANPAERPLVARVFLNRLNKGMKLQTDPTVIYALTHGENTLDRPLSHADLQTPSAYNTYFTQGLPPGPICAPGVSSLTAAAHPATSDALFFVADGMGGHHFSATLAEHNHNVTLLRKKQQQPQ